MFEISADGTLHFVSKPLARALGVEESNLIGKNWLDFTSPTGSRSSPQWMSLPFQVPGDAQSLNFECTMSDANDADIRFEITAIALKKTRFAMVCHEITKQKRKEAKLIDRVKRLRNIIETQDEELATVRHFTAVELTREILHEASQPLTAIRCYGGIARTLLENQIPEAEKIDSLVQTMIRSSQLTADILRRFCDSTSGRFAVLSSEDIGELVNDVTQLLAFPAEKECITLQSRIDAGTAMLDRTQIQQVLLNLIKNSIEATENNTGMIEVSAHRKPQYWEFTVSDNGPGVSKDQVERLFLPIKSTKQDGVGVGLSVAQSIVRCHGGVIQYSPLYPTGARFRFKIPTDTTASKGHGLAPNSSSSTTRK